MKEIKEFVNNNIIFEDDDLGLLTLHTKFNSIIDHLKINKNRSVFDSIVKKYIEGNNWYYMMSFICLVAANNKILDEDEKTILDIVEAVFDSDLSVTKYKFFLNILLNKNITDWLHLVHTTIPIRLSPKDIIVNIITDYDANKSVDRNLDDINGYLNEILKDQEKLDDKSYFSNTNSFDEISHIIEDKMKEYNQFTETYGNFTYYSDEKIKDCKYIRRLKHLSLENQKKALDILHDLDNSGDDISFIKKCFSIVNTAKILYNSYGEEKVITVDFTKK